ncbi:MULTISPECIES: hypothetical protein [unclassified Bacillus (in: firmicutes)]|uniref:hypothetical protein n=1 Tax=unclassified Bacillus (in: firmicutes) TaxID=185979 RepID=UPI002FFEBFE5
MSELKAEEVLVNKKPIWKNKRVLIIGILVVLFLAFKVGSSPSVPEGIEEEHYKSALWVFHELNMALEEKEYPSEDVISWIRDHRVIIEEDSSLYTVKEININEMLMVMAAGVATMDQELAYKTRASIAELLEVDEDY